MRSADGVVVEASIVARLLSIPLLTLDATVVIVPADATAPRPAARQLAPTRPAARSGALGHRLVEAVRSIDEGAAMLAEARRTGPPPRRALAKRS
jgi:pyridoxal biosynthesis lyase PdxS